MTIKMIENERCCRNCRFWVSDEVKSFGRCHRYPPQFWSEGEECGASHVGTNDTEWCGEFESVDVWILPEGFELVKDKPGAGICHKISAIEIKETI